MGCTIAALKLLIIVPNIIFFCIGCLEIGWTSYNLIKYHDDIQQMDEERKTFIYATSGASIASSVILCIVSFLAVCGALADKRRMLKAYAIILCLVILLQITAAIIAFVIPDKIKAWIDELDDKDKKDILVQNLEFLKDNIWYFGLALIIMVCIEIILALSACFLSTQIKQDRVWTF